MIDIEDLSVYYGRKRGVHHLNLSVQAGEIFGFLGPNGAGKSTTLRVLLDIIRPTTGNASIFGLDCQKQGVQIRRRVAYLPGELNLFTQLRADEYFDRVNAIRRQSSDAAYLKRLCERLSLDPGHPMRTYSRGNKQKVGLVAAFMTKPDLLILDEPTGGLDPLVQQAVLELVQEAHADGRTVFFSSHVLSEVQAVCHRVGIVRDGQMVATERVETLRRGSFHRLKLRFERMPFPGELDQEGVRETARTDQLVTFEIQDNLSRFLARAAVYGICDLEDNPFSLEEIFLAYYGKSGGNAHG